MALPSMPPVVSKNNKNKIDNLHNVSKAVPDNSTKLLQPSPKKFMNNITQKYGQSQVLNEQNLEPGFDESETELN